jgi:predicted permease
MQSLRQLFSRRRRYDDLSLSIREHLDEKIEELIDEGMPRTEAERTARREFGNAVLIEERSREIWQWQAIESLWADAKFALRRIRKSPGISFIAILTLALGVGANTAVFTLTWAIILKGLPVPNPGQLVQYGMRNGGSTMGLSGPEYTVLRREQKTSEDLLAWCSDKVSVRSAATVHEERIQLLTGNAFHVLQIQPYVGDFFSEQQDADGGNSQGTPAVLSYAYWQSQFHGSPSAIGQSFFLDDRPVTILGVMPPAFDGLTANFQPSIYLPLSFGDLLYAKDFRTHPGSFRFFTLGRLKPGIPLANAVAEAKAIEPSVRKQADPTGIYMNQFFKAFRLDVQSGRSGVSWVKMAYARPLLVMEMLVVFLLALCCVNTALVMLARVSGRQQEYAMRSALGARRSSLIRQVLVETSLLIVPGLIGGVFVGWIAANALVSMLGSRGTPTQMDLHPNAVILAVNALSALLVALGAGLWPALRASRIAPSLDLKAGSHTITSNQIGGLAVSLQVAVCLSLVTCAVLVSGLLVGLSSEPSGFHTESAAIATIDLQSLKLKDAELASLSSRLLDAVKAKPGVIAAGFIDEPPLSGSFGASRLFSIDRYHAIHSDPSVFYLRASSGYFDAVGTRLLEGDPQSSLSGVNTCVLSRSSASFFFPHESALRQLVYFSTWPKPDGTQLDLKNACRVTAVVEDAKYVSLRQPAPRIFYQVFRPDTSAHDFAGMNYLVVRASSDVLAVAALRSATQQTLPSTVDVTIDTLTHLAHQDLSRERMLVSVSSVFAVLALLLTALGLYGLLMRTVTLRTREIGIRVALGAQRRSILLSIGSRAIFQTAIGLAAGTIVSLLAASAVRKLLEVQPGNSFSSLLWSGVALLVVAIFAVVAPARRAASIDPMQALRSE